MQTPRFHQTIPINAVYTGIRIPRDLSRINDRHMAAGFRLLDGGLHAHISTTHHNHTLSGPCPVHNDVAALRDFRAGGCRRPPSISQNAE